MFTDIDYLIYSSHKTSTQTLLNTLQKNNVKTSFLHNMSNICVLYPDFDFCKNKGHGKRLGWGELEKTNIFKELTLKNIEKYKNNNNKKISIISVVRNPKERLLSSLFQTFHTDEMMYQGKKYTETTIYKLDENEIYNLYCNEIKNNSLPGGIEAIDEMSYLFDIDIINHLQKEEDYYYFENDLIKLYVLKFNCVINENSLHYLNNILQTNLIQKETSNLSIDKVYYNKYNKVKTMVKDDINNIINDRYNKFYFSQ
jgi:hypothetical protein